MMCNDKGIWKASSALRIEMASFTYPRQHNYVNCVHCEKCFTWPLKSQIGWEHFFQGKSDEELLLRITPQCCSTHTTSWHKAPVVHPSVLSQLSNLFLLPAAHKPSFPFQLHKSLCNYMVNWSKKVVRVTTNFPEKWLIFTWINSLTELTLWPHNTNVPMVNGEQSPCDVTSGRGPRLYLPGGLRPAV